VLESADPYSNGTNSPSGLTVQKHLQSAQFVSDRTSSSDNDKIKQAVMNYGGIYSACYWADANYNSANCAYYYNGSESANHTPTIVGWDDSFSRTRFNSPYPAGDGAFLCKNSWGSSWGDAGYFWISYYDTIIGTDNCLFLNAESANNYASIYQYDTLGMCAAFGYGTTTGWGANIFTGTSGTIKAVSFYAPSDGASYEVRVYTGVTAGKPSSGKLSATKTGTLTYAGYYTVVLDSPVTYSTRFSMVVKLTTPGYNYPIAAEYRISDYSSKATASAGESYTSANGSSWDEAYDDDDGIYFHVCIKAFGTGGEEPTPTPLTLGPVIKANGSTNDITISHSDDLSITVQLDPGQYIGVSVDWWIVARSGATWIYLDSSAEWKLEGAWHPVYQGGLFNLPATQVWNYGLPVGSYTFYFILAYPMDGLLDGEFWYNSVNVTVQ
jgi:hypothetical protein